MSKKNTVRRAYLLSIRDDPDEGSELVFDLTAKKARSQIFGTDMQWENWIDVAAHRAKQWDYLENANQRERYKEFWREGWWFHQSGYPDADEGTDEEFYEWYDSTFGDKI